MRPHRRQPTRLPRPWDSPGKNTGVGCHFLLQCMKGKSESEDARSCPTLSDPMDCSPPGSSIHGIFQQEYWSGVPLPSPHMSAYICKFKAIPYYTYFKAQYKKMKWWTLRSCWKIVWMYTCLRTHQNRNTCMMSHYIILFSPRMLQMTISTAVNTEKSNVKTQLFQGTWKYLVGC